MTDMILLSALPAAALWFPKWWRVTQREHYLFGSIASALIRWISSTATTNGPLAGVGLAAAAATLVLDDGQAQIAGLVAVAAAATFPFGLPTRGRSSALNFTRRMRTTAALSVVLWIGIVAAIRAASNSSIAVAFASIFGWIAIEASIAISGPIERRLSSSFKKTAKQKLDAVRPTTVAITGSYGKTSTKEHLSKLVGHFHPTIASPASWNNQNGLSRAINEYLTPGTEVFVAEMGTYGKGEIRDLCEWVRPEIVAITSIGPMHLQRMKTIQRIVEAKLEICNGARSIVLNVDSPELLAAASQFTGPAKVIRCSTSRTTNADVRLVKSEKDENYTLDYFGTRFKVPRLNESVHASNVVIAVTLAVEAGAEIERILPLIGSLESAAHRAKVITSAEGVSVIDDTFNSNPAGAEKALSDLVGQNLSGRCAVITPGMIELGIQQERRNREFGRLVVDAGCDLVVVGKTNREALKRGAADAGGSVIALPNRDRAREWVRQNLSDGDGVLWENDLPDHYA